MIGILFWTKTTPFNFWPSPWGMFLLSSRRHGKQYFGTIQSCKNMYFNIILCTFCFSYWCRSGKFMKLANHMPISPANWYGLVFVSERWYIHTCFAWLLKTVEALNSWIIIKFHCNHPFIEQLFHYTVVLKNISSKPAIHVVQYYFRCKFSKKVILSNFVV